MCPVSKTQLEKMVALLLLIYVGLSGGVLVDISIDSSLPWNAFLFFSL